MFPIVVNRVDKGNRVVFLRGDDVLVRVADLQDAGLHDFDGRREEIAGETYVALSSLGPDTTFHVDEKSVTLQLTVTPRLLNTNVINLREEKPANLSYESDPSLFLNYALNWEDFTRPDPFGFAESGLSLFGTQLYGSAGRGLDGSFMRGLTNWTYDDVPNMRRWVIGDRFAGSGGLGGGLLLGGLSVSRDFNLDPYFIRFPTPGLAGAALSPSTLDVYVNGVFVSRKDLPPGPFDLRDLPITSGSGSTRFVLRDAFGREQEVVSPYYVSTGVLSEGLQEYSYNVGYERTSLTTPTGEYGDPAFLGIHRVGVTDWLTLGGRLEASTDLVSGGPKVAFLTPFGEINLEAAASGQRGRTGAAGLAAYRYLGRRFSCGVFTQAMSTDYTNLSIDLDHDRARVNVTAYAGVQVFDNVNLNLTFTSIDWRDRGWQNRLGISSTIRLSRDFSAFLSVGPGIPGSSGGVDVPGNPARRQNTLPETVAFAGISYYFSGTSTASVFRQQMGSHGSTGVEVQKPLPFGTGFGYRVRSQLGDDQYGVGGVAQYQGPWGLYEAEYNHLDGVDSGRVTVAGGLVAIGGGLHATRPVNDSFALVRVADVPNVRGYLNNQEVGRTDSSGDLFVPDMQSYYGNVLTIEDRDLPLNYSIGNREYVVAPPFHGGTVVRFDVQRVQGFTGSMVLESGGAAVVPAFGELTVTVADKVFVSPLGKHGEFYLQNVPVGAHPAFVLYGGKQCDFTFEIPESEESFVVLGIRQCRTP